MKKVISVLLLLVVLAAGCSSTIEVPTAIPVNPTATVQSASATATAQLPPPSKCQSKLLGKVQDANGALAKGATIEIKGGSFSGKTLSDDNGLYGFAGLCAGTYTFSVTLSGQAAKAVATTATLDGSNSVKTDLQVK